MDKHDDIKITSFIKAATEQTIIEAGKASVFQSYSDIGKTFLGLLILGILFAIGAYLGDRDTRAKNKPIALNKPAPRVEGPKAWDNFYLEMLVKEKDSTNGR